MAYEIEKLPMERLIGPVAQAIEALTRLDERLAKSPVCDGWIERSHFHDAAATLWLEGELVHVEDLVLHDARMDIRTPTHELTRAHAVLRTRRQIFANKPQWALSRDGILALRGRGADKANGLVEDANSREGEGAYLEEDSRDDEESDDLLSEEFAAIDAVLKRSGRILDGIEASSGKRKPPAAERDFLVYDLDWNEDERFCEWRAVCAQTEGLPEILRAAILNDAWNEIEPLQHAPWLGSLWVAAFLRQAGMTQNHFACINVGLRTIPRERRRSRDRIVRLLAFLDAIHEAASGGLKEHDRLVLAREQMQRHLKGRRSNSKLPRLIELALARPLVFTTMIQKELKVTKQGALNLVAEFKLREMTGRRRFQAWGIVSAQTSNRDSRGDSAVGRV